MKKAAIVITTLMIFSLSCKKLTEDIINCATESILLGIKYTANSQDPKKITFEVRYYGDYTLDHNINWDFGDGHSESNYGLTVEHTYDSTGTYDVKAEISLSSDDNSCSTTINKKVEVN